MYIGAVIAYLIPHFNICLKILTKTKGRPASGPVNELSTFRYKALSSAVQ
jgi:hypothetical protein